MTKNRDLPAYDRGTSETIISAQNEHGNAIPLYIHGGITKREAAAISIAAGISGRWSDEDWNTERDRTRSGGGRRRPVRRPRKEGNEVMQNQDFWWKTTICAPDARVNSG